MPCRHTENVIDKQHAAASAVLGYETIALAAGGRLPTITALCARHRWLSLLVIGSLVVHLRPWLAVIVVVPE